MTSKIIKMFSQLEYSHIIADGSWTDPTTIQHRVLDEIVEERYFDCQVRRSHLFCPKTVFLILFS